MIVWMWCDLPPGSRYVGDSYVAVSIVAVFRVSKVFGALADTMSVCPLGVAAHAPTRGRT